MTEGMTVLEKAALILGKALTVTAGDDFQKEDDSLWTDEAAEVLASAGFTREQMQMPAGSLVVVPAIPTIEQMFAGQNVVAPDVPASPGPVSIPMTTGSFGAIYRAMIAARPGSGESA